VFHKGLLLENIKPKGRDLSTSDVFALMKLLERDWWERLWVLQEVALARNVLVYCGFDRFRFVEAISPYNMAGKLASFWCCQASQGVDRNRLPNALLRISPHAYLFVRLREPSNIKGTELMWVLSWVNRGMKVTNDRDRVYGLLSFFPRILVKEVDPNYSLSVSALYQKITFLLIRESGNLGFLGEAKIAHRTHKYTFPTWVPDLSDPDRRIHALHRHRLYSACSHRGLGAINSVGSTLYLTGAHFDTVIRSQRIDSVATKYSKATVAEFRTWHNHWQAFFHPAFQENRNSLYISGGSLEEAYWKTITIDLCGQTNNEKYYRFRRQIEDGECEYVEWLRTGGNDPTNEWSPNPNWQCHPAIEPFLFALLGLMQDQNSTLIVTERGYFGIALGDSDVRIGDQVYILGGGNLPCLLRPSQDRRMSTSDTFLLVCECYIHGIMDGEAVAGVQKTEELMLSDMLRKLMFGGPDQDPNLPLTQWKNVGLC
jgi:hypothetical protein